MLSFGWCSRRRELIVEEKDIQTIMKVFNKQFGWFEGQIGNCCWKEEPTKWFITFDCSKTEFTQLVRELNKRGTFELNTSSEEVKLYFKVNEGES